MRHPCRECGERRVGCHRKCARFLAWDIMDTERRKRIAKKRAAEGELVKMDVDRSYAKRKKISGKKVPER